jgi:hypothetical protein
LSALALQIWVMAAAGLPIDMETPCAMTGGSRNFYRLVEAEIAANGRHWQGWTRSTPAR